MESELRAAIHAAPTDLAPRRALAAHWAGRPEADLIPLLLDRPDSDDEEAIEAWFATYQGWPPRVSTTEPFTNLAPVHCDNWIFFAFDPERWLDPDRWRAAVVALARRRLQNARDNFEPDDQDRACLEQLATTPWTAPLPTTGADRAEEERSMAFRYRPRRDHAPACQAIRAAQWIAMRLDLPFDDLGSGAGLERSEQYHVLGWTWLGLPPLRAEAPPEQTYAARPTRWWRRLRNWGWHPASRVP